MNRATRFLLPGALILAAGAAFADPPATSVQAPTNVSPAVATASSADKAQTPGDKVVCKYEVPTGSRLGGHKTCMKKSEWDAQAAEARRTRDFAPPAGIGGAH
jgi:hypothetical protein